ncbi:MAG: hypothetical protein IKC31_03330 [Clostridia bacterium]|nr:hypothetical protein [Clostridia bacterium]
MKRRTQHNNRFEYDEEGRAIIDMTVSDDSSFLSVYSKHASPVISSEVAEFIENSTRSLPPKQALTLRIHSDCIDGREKELYRSAIGEYYSEKYHAERNELQFNFWAVLFLTLAGVVALVLAFWVDHHIWSEVIDIAAWVFLWEAVDIGAFKNRESRHMRRRCLSYLSMKIEYVPLKNAQKEAE